MPTALRVTLVDGVRGGYSGDPMVLGSSCRKREGMSILDIGIVLC